MTAPYTQLDVGSTADDMTGDKLRPGGTIINDFIQGLEDHENNVTGNPHAVRPVDVAAGIAAIPATSYTVTASDHGKCVHASAFLAILVDLTAAATLGSGFWCLITTSGITGATTIDPAGGETINGAGTLVLSGGGTYDSAWIITDGVEWLARVF